MYSVPTSESCKASQVFSTSYWKTFLIRACSLLFNLLHPFLLLMKHLRALTFCFLVARCMIGETSNCLRLVVRKGDHSARAVDVKSSAAVRDLEIAVGLSSREALSFGGKVVTKGEASLKSLGVTSNTVINVEVLTAWGNDERQPNL